MPHAGCMVRQKALLHPRQIALVMGVFSVILPFPSAWGEVPSSPIPRAYPESRYLRIWENSPFELEAPPPTVAAKSETSFAAHLHLVGVTRVKGKLVVTLHDQKAGMTFDLYEESERNGLQLVSVESSRDPLGTRVRLAKGGREASVGYDQQLLAAKNRPAQVRPNPTRPSTAPSGQPSQRLPLRLPSSSLNRGKTAPTPPVSPQRRIIPGPTTSPTSAEERRARTVPQAEGSILDGQPG
ncbi:MAG: hypothetical protein AAF191_20220 [Verrucomicrobiota bacterium]